MWINGIGGGVALALGALCSTLVPGNWDPRLTYAAAGVTNALAAVFLLAANRPAVYLAGTSLYLVTEGLCAGLEKGTPEGRIRSKASGRVLSRERLGGLHHRYNRAA